MDHGTSKAGIDWDFISRMEGGQQLSGYIPEDKSGAIIGKSGMTISTGWDVGQMSVDELQTSELSPEIINMAKPFVGLKGEEAARKLLSFGAPTISESQALEIDEYTHGKTLDAISASYKSATGGKEFSDLTSAQQTVTASVGFQYGPKGLMTKKDRITGADVPTDFWGQVTEGDWSGAYENLMNYGDDYGYRREQEANVLGKDIAMQSMLEAEQPIIPKVVESPQGAGQGVGSLNERLAALRNR